MQLTNAFNHLQACGIEDISLDEIFVCKRDADVESKLLLLPISIDYITGVDKVSIFTNLFSFRVYMYVRALIKVVLPAEYTFENVAM